MAKDVTGQPWKFDAVDQYEGWANRAAAVAPVFDTVKPFVDFIQIESGAAGGTFDVRVTDGGKPITGTLTLAANTSVQVNVGKYVDGVYMETMTDGQILVFHGEEA